MNEFLEFLKEIFEKIAATDLPQRTLTDFVNIIRYDFEMLTALAYQYIAVIFN